MYRATLSMTALAVACAMAWLPLSAHAQDPQPPGPQSSGDPPPQSEAPQPERSAGKSPALTAAAVNASMSSTPVDADASAAAVLRAQVLLDRAHFSPGEIDGAFGSNTRTAIAGFQRSRDLDPSGAVDAETWSALDADGAAALVNYTLTTDDIDGPFVEIPADIEAKAALDALAYTSALEALGEQFHASPSLLKRLNPDSRFAAGDTIWVPNVDQARLAAANKVVVDESASTIMLLDAAGKTYAQFPATMGSQHDPLPIGEWTIKGVAADPVFHYNPELFWDAEASDSKAVIAAGPNNPVGAVWIDLSKPHYGIHGTPEPSTIGKTESHGCIRMTNWSAHALAQAVSTGTPAVLRE